MVNTVKTTKQTNILTDDMTLNKVLDSPYNYPIMSPPILSLRVNIMVCFLYRQLLRTIYD